MDEHEWYDTMFIPEVKKYQNEIGELGNVLLLLDNVQDQFFGWNILERENGFKV